MYVVADKPITVITGASLTTTLPVNDIWPTCEQLPAASKLGTVHIVVPHAGRAVTTGYFVQVVAAHDDTMVTLTSGVTYLQRGEQKLVFMNSPKPTTVKCSFPCLVLMYGKDGKADAEHEFTGHFMSLVPSVSQTITSGWFNTFDAYL